MDPRRPVVGGEHATARGAAAAEALRDLGLVQQQDILARVHELIQLRVHLPDQPLDPDARPVELLPAEWDRRG